jgi:hypothetical protein
MRWVLPVTSYQRRQRKKVGKQASFLQLVILHRLRVLPRVSARSWKQAMQDCHVPSSANLMPSYLSPRDMSSSFDPAPSFQVYTPEPRPLLSHPIQPSEKHSKKASPNCVSISRNIAKTSDNRHFKCLFPLSLIRHVPRIPNTPGTLASVTLTAYDFRESNVYASVI